MSKEAERKKELQDKSDEMYLNFRLGKYDNYTDADWERDGFSHVDGRSTRKEKDNDL